MPPCDAGYLLEILFEIGPTMAAGMGAGPITHGEIASWVSLTGIELQPWEVRALRSVSVAYVDQSHAAKRHDCPPPWMISDAKVDFSSVQQSLRQLAKS